MNLWLSSILFVSMAYDRLTLEHWSSGAKIFIFLLYIMLDLGFTVLFIVPVVFMFISTWTETINRTIIQYFDLDKEAAGTWLKLAIGFTILLFVVVSVWNIELHELFGLSETVDLALTGMKERFKNGRLIHYK
jgi:hypothetical protein